MQHHTRRTAMRYHSTMRAAAQRRIWWSVLVLTLLLALSNGLTTQAANPAFLVKDINPAVGLQRYPLWSPLDLVSVGNYAYFIGAGPDTGQELWRTDGTANGTALVEDIRPGLLGSNPFSLTNILCTLSFTA